MSDTGRDPSADEFEKWLTTDYADAAMQVEHPQGFVLLKEMYRYGSAATRELVATLTGFDKRKVTKE